MLALADVVSRNGAGSLAEVTALGKAAGPLPADAEVRASVAQKARAHGRPDAVGRLADVVLSAAAG